jgi:hypothetical protein
MRKLVLFLAIVVNFSFESKQPQPTTKELNEKCGSMDHQCLEIATTFVNVYVSYNPNYSSSYAAWSITLDNPIGITTYFSQVELRGYVNSNGCSEPYGHQSFMPLITFKNVSTGVVVLVSKMPTNVVDWKLIPGWILVNYVEFFDGAQVLLDNGVVLIIHIQNQNCS